MITVDLSSIAFDIDESKLPQLVVRAEDDARDALANVWDEEREYLVNFLAVFYPDNGVALSEQGFFVTLAFVKHGYIAQDATDLSVAEIKQQMIDDLDVLNREAGWTQAEKIFFEQFWPEPSYDADSRQLDFGLMLRDNNNVTINKTINRFVLTRYGHLELNVSIQDVEMQKNLPLSHYLDLLNRISSAIQISAPFRYEDIDYDNDTPSKSALVHLALSAEKF